MLMRGSEFVFDSVQLMYYKYKVNFRCDGSYTDSPYWMKKKKKHTKNENDKSFQYAVMVALNYGETESYPEIVSNI